MQLQKQSWEVLAEASRILEDRMSYLMRKGVLEWNVLMWLAEYRRKTNTEANQWMATIMEDAAKDLEKVAQEAHDAGMVPDNPPKHEISDEDIQRELDETLPPLLNSGTDDAVVVRWLALFRKDVSLDDKRENKARPVDLQFARVLYAASEELETALSDFDEPDLVSEEEDGPSAEESEAPQRIVLMPGARILNRNPKLLDGCTDFVRLMNRLNHTGRNQRCPCNSGKKFKKCCGSS